MRKSGESGKPVARTGCAGRPTSSIAGVASGSGGHLGGLDAVLAFEHNSLPAREGASDVLGIGPMQVFGFHLPSSVGADDDHTVVIVIAVVVGIVHTRIVKTARTGNGRGDPD